MLQYFLRGRSRHDDRHLAWRWQYALKILAREIHRAQDSSVVLADGLVQLHTDPPGTLGRMDAHKTYRTEAVVSQNTNATVDLRKIRCRVVTAGGLVRTW